MPKNPVTDPITDQEIAFAHLVLAGTMTDRRAAEAVGLKPETAAYAKAKPRVQAYMHQHRETMNNLRVQQETEELQRKNLLREQVLARLFEIAALSHEVTRNSASAQIKALSLIIAMEGLLPDRRPSSAGKTSAETLAVPQNGRSFGLPDEHKEKPTGPQPTPGPARDEEEPGAAEHATSDLGRTPGSNFDGSALTCAGPSSPAESAPSPLHTTPSASAPTTRTPNRTEAKSSTWRLRL